MSHKERFSFLDETQSHLSPFGIFLDTFAERSFLYWSVSAYIEASYFVELQTWWQRRARFRSSLAIATLGNVGTGRVGSAVRHVM